MNRTWPMKDEIYICSRYIWDTTHPYSCANPNTRCQQWRAVNTAQHSDLPNWPVCKACGYTPPLPKTISGRMHDATGALRLPLRDILRTCWSEWIRNILRTTQLWVTQTTVEPHSKSTHFIVTLLLLFIVYCYSYHSSIMEISPLVSQLAPLVAVCVTFNPSPSPSPSRVRAELPRLSGLVLDQT